jgi:hypothetical protein
MLLPNRFPIPISNKPGIEEEVIIVPIPIDPIEGLSSTINLARTPTTSSFYSPQLRTLPEIISILSSSILNILIPRAFNSL